MFPFGLIAIPFPIDSEENTGSLTEPRVVISPARGLTIVSTVVGSSAFAIDLYLFLKYQLMFVQQLLLLQRYWKILFYHRNK